VSENVIFLKLGGSLITDKRREEAARLEVIQQVAAEIAAAQQATPGLHLVIGHGSGSFGHIYGRRYGTRSGVRSPEEWYGFAATGDAAARLNRIVTGTLLGAGIAAWGIQPSVALRCTRGRIVAGPEETVQLALENGLTPVVFGDVVLDSEWGGTIASTEEIFEWLAPSLRPVQLILAGEVDGIYTGDPFTTAGAERISQITPATLASVRAGLGGSHGVDVTGGMAAKVEQALAMVRQLPGLEVVICGGGTAGNLYQLLTEPNSTIGTRISGK
jgi:isopentenyl phosphate kinase